MELMREHGDGFLGHPQAPETRIPPKRLASKVLCRRHNTMLGPYDATAKQLYLALDAAIERPASRVHLFNGYDVQSWMLKALLGMVAGKAASAKGRPLQFSGLDPWVSVLFRRRALCLPLPPRSGLYIGMKDGDPVVHRPRLRVAPLLATEDHSVAGLELSMRGIVFRLLVRSVDPAHPLVDGYSLRPRSFEMGGEQGSLFIFSW